MHQMVARQGEHLLAVAGIGCEGASVEAWVIELLMPVRGDGELRVDAGERQ
ncbi:hypothetical protein [Massilia sp. CCM 8734]|uniref:hypothetical protein n=1 Tax=Massilia sp. CCM 8734 TaxID=2609283 RepID=UPI0014204D83|nr:hypothetical protein [Massilia sp. CCM 8734]